jgi:hypothetical protein
MRNSKSVFAVFGPEKSKLVFVFEALWMPYELSWTPRPANGNEALRFDFATAYFIIVQGKIGFYCFVKRTRTP